MVDGITPVDGTPTGASAPPARAGAASRPFAVAGADAAQLPDLPPAEVLDALDTAARVLTSSTASRSRCGWTTIR